MQPHTLDEKGFLRNAKDLLTPSPLERDGVRSCYEKAHAGLPLVQHSLSLMLYYYKQGQ
jgi:dihydroorotase